MTLCLDCGNPVEGPRAVQGATLCRGCSPVVKYMPGEYSK